MTNCDVKKIAFIVALVGFNVFLFYAATLFAIPLLVVCGISAIGALIGIRTKSAGRDAAIRALAGSAIGVLNIFVFSMSIFGRLLGP